MNSDFLRLVIENSMPWEKLLELLSEFNTSLCTCQKEFSSIGKNTNAYNFKYAKFEEIREATKDVLSDNQLFIEQWLAGTHESPELHTKLRHNNGYFELHKTPMILSEERTSKLQAEQEVGKALSYYKRYIYCSLLGIITKEADIDDDQPKQQIPEGELPPCPKCNKPLRERKGPSGIFYGCSGYPECKFTLRS